MYSPNPSLACGWGVGESQFRRREKKRCTLSTLWYHYTGTGTRWFPHLQKQLPYKDSISWSLRNTGMLTYVNIIIFSLHSCVDLKYFVNNFYFLFYKPFSTIIIQSTARIHLSKIQIYNYPHNSSAICLHFSRTLTCQRRNSPLLKYTNTSTAMDNLL